MTFPLLHRTPHTPHRGQGHGALRLECLIHGKGLAGMTHQEAKARRHLIHIGDVVQAWGYLDESRGHYILEPRGFRVLEPWRVPGREPRVVSCLSCCV
jgi:hypothetical protein